MLRATWQAEYGDIPAEYYVWLDESSVDNLVHQRRSGWSDIGMACVSRDTFIRGQRFSILPALGPDGIVALDIFEGSVNKEHFIQFLNEQLVCPFVTIDAWYSTIIHSIQVPQLNPFPGPLSVVILDNCTIHHDDDIRRLIEDDCGNLH